MSEIEIVSVELVETDEAWEDHTTYYALRVRGDYFRNLNRDTPDVTNLDHYGWRLNGSDLTIHPGEVDAYIELLQKIKAASDDPD